MASGLARSAGQTKHAIEHPGENHGVDQKKQQDANVGHEGLPQDTPSHSAITGTRISARPPSNKVPWATRRRQERPLTVWRASQRSNTALKP